MREDRVRPATAADLPSIGEIWYANQVLGDPSPPPYGGTPSLYAHELSSGELHVAERDGEVVAFASAITRGEVVLLADLFVRPAQHGTGLGRRLLNEVLPGDGRSRCTLSSTDPRALPLYVRQGMRPRWPHIQLVAPLPDLRPVPRVEVEVVEAGPGDPELLRWDAEIGGRQRPQDHAYWVARRGGTPLWLGRGGRRIGYAYAQTNSDDLLWYPGAVTLGPLGVRDEGDAVPCTLAVVDWARSRAPIARIPIPGPHPALAPLLELGFQIVYVETFCSSADEPFADVTRYLSSGSDLF